jgi:hypothetical protein
VLSDHLALFARGAATPTVGVTLYANMLASPPTGRVLVEIPAGYFMDAPRVRRLAERLGRAADQLDEITGAKAA